MTMIHVRGASFVFCAWLTCTLEAVTIAAPNANTPKWMRKEAKRTIVDGAVEAKRTIEALACHGVPPYTAWTEKETDTWCKLQSDCPAKYCSRTAAIPSPTPARTRARTLAPAPVVGCTADKCNACLDCANEAGDWLNQIKEAKNLVQSEKKNRKKGRPCNEVLEEMYNHKDNKALHQCMRKYGSCGSMLMCGYDELSFCKAFKNSFCQESLARVSLFQSDANATIHTSRHDYLDGVPQPDSNSVAASTIQRQTLSSTKNADGSDLSADLGQRSQDRASSGIGVAIDALGGTTGDSTGQRITSVLGNDLDNTVQGKCAGQG